LSSAATGGASVVQSSKEKTVIETVELRPMTVVPQDIQVSMTFDFCVSFQQYITQNN
jgi:hypothetical protein